MASATNSSTFRNPNGVSMKLANIASLDPAHTGAGLRAGGRNDAAVWDEFQGDAAKVAQAAAAIRERVREPHYWAFNANPQVYRIEAAGTDLTFDTWITQGH